MGFFNVSCGASVFMALYMALAAVNLYRLMFPLAFVNLSDVPSNKLVKPYWTKASKMHLRAYISTHENFNTNFLRAGFLEKVDSDDHNYKDSAPNYAALLWEEDINSPAFSKSFLLTSLDCETRNDCERDASYNAAVSWLDQAEKIAIDRGEGGVLATLQAAGHGIESTSVLLTMYQSLSKSFRSLLESLSILPKSEKDEEHISSLLGRTSVVIPPDSPIWRSLTSNSTVYLHVLVLQTGTSAIPKWPPANAEEAIVAVKRASRAFSLLVDQVNLIKYDAPHHIGKPKRILFNDIIYLYNKYVKYSREMPPWVMALSKPEEYAAYQQAMSQKREKAGYPYWKPEVAIKYVNDDMSYPYEVAGLSGMQLVELGRSSLHPTGIALMPALHVDEIGLTSDKYIPMNSTVTTLPLRVSFDRSDIEHKVSTTTANAGALSPARWRLLSHLSQAIEAQKELGFDQSDIDDLRRLIADTNITLLAITMLASALHLLFEFLTFKSEVSFWSKNKDLTGLSVRSLFLDMIGQTIILFFLIDKDSSLLMTVPSAIGCLIALWKCQRAAGLRFVRTCGTKRISWFNWIPSLFGFELRATRLEVADKESKDLSTQERLTTLTLEADRMATRTLGSFLLPFVFGYAIYSLVREEHTGWYSWLITTASSAVYALGFVLMTPQLFLNWKLKSVAHLPWRVLVYKSLNTFIDDLFSFIIRMPTMARISCFRDDIVFFVYLYQRWLYPVDESRPVEGGGEGEPQEVSESKKKQ